MLYFKDNAEHNRIRGQAHAVGVQIVFFAGDRKCSEVKTEAAENLAHATPTLHSNNPSQHRRLKSVTWKNAAISIPELTTVEPLQEVFDSRMYEVHLISDAL